MIVTIMQLTFQGPEHENKLQEWLYGLGCYTCNGCMKFSAILKMHRSQDGLL